MGTWVRGHHWRVKDRTPIVSRAEQERIRAFNDQPKAIYGTDEWRANVRRGLQLRALRNPKTRPTTSPRMLDIAWAAGLYEGEGTISLEIGQKTGRPRFMVSVSQNEPEILLRLKAMFGGGVARTTVRATHHIWYLNGLRAHGFLLTIFSFLSRRRRDQVLRAIVHA